MSDQEPRRAVVLRLEGLAECYRACKEFVRKAEAGEVFDEYFYARMKAAIEHTEGGHK